MNEYPKILRSPFAGNPVAVQVSPEECILGSTIEEAPEICDPEIIEIWIAEQPNIRERIVGRLLEAAVEELSPEVVARLKAYLEERGFGLS